MVFLASTVVAVPIARTADATTDAPQPEEPAPYLVVRVSDGSGSPVEGTQIVARIVRDAESKLVERVYSTDSQGVVRIPHLSRRLSFFGLSVMKSGYLPVRTQWRTNKPIPQDYNYTLERGASVGGAVQDEAGNPIAGARVYVRFISQAHQGRRDRLNYRDHFEVTDVRGRWRCHEAPTKFEQMAIRLEHSYFLSDTHFGMTSTPSLESLRNLKSVKIMRKGHTVEGIVTAPDGSPVGDAVIGLGRSRYGSRFPTTRTNDRGEFRFEHCAAGETIVTVVSQRWAAELRRVVVGPEMERITIRLKIGRTLRVRVVDKDGRPVPGAWIAPDMWRDHRTLGTELGIPRETDSNGNWVWDLAPDDEIQFHVLKQGLM